MGFIDFSLRSTRICRYKKGILRKIRINVDLSSFWDCFLRILVFNLWIKAEN
jgi:hypothetical protein